VLKKAISFGSVFSGSKKTEVNIMVPLRVINTFNVNKIKDPWLNIKKFNLAINCKLLYSKDILDLKRCIMQETSMKN
jgi:hypothetical protein